MSFNIAAEPGISIARWQLASRRPDALKADRTLTQRRGRRQAHIVFVMPCRVPSCCKNRFKIDSIARWLAFTFL